MKPNVRPLALGLGAESFAPLFGRKKIAYQIQLALTASGNKIGP